LISKLVSSEDRPRIERHNVSRDTMNGMVSLGFGVSLVTEISAPVFPVSSIESCAMVPVRVASAIRPIDGLRMTTQFWLASWHF
jgi:hypothetical protein